MKRTKAREGAQVRARAQEGKKGLTTKIAAAAYARRQ
jgi:hypothetical protein